MAETINQLIEEMQAMRARLSDGPETGDADASMSALDQAMGVLAGAASPEPEIAPHEDIDDTPPYAIVTAEPGPPDNLTFIRGISSATAYALSSLGITRFAHIAGFTARDVAALQNDLGYRCTIHRDNWIEQAALLASGGTTSFSRRGAPMAAPVVEAGQPETTRPVDIVPDIRLPDAEEENSSILPTEPVDIVPAAETDLVETAPELDVDRDVPEPFEAAMPVEPESVAQIGATAALLGSLAAAVALDHKDEKADTHTADEPGSVQQEAESLIADALPEIMIEETSANVLGHDLAHTDVADNLEPIDLQETNVAFEAEDIISPPGADDESMIALPVEITSPVVLAAPLTTESSLVGHGDVDAQPASLIEEPITEHTEENVFASLPPPVAVVPLEQPPSVEINDDPAMSGLLVADAPLSTPEAITSAAQPDASPSAVEEPFPIAMDELSPTPQPELEPLIAGLNDAVEPEPLIVANEIAMRDAAAIEREASTVADVAQPHVDESSHTAPLDFSPGEPVFAPVIGGAAAPNGSFDDVRININHHDDEASAPVGDDQSSTRPGLIDRVKAASGGILANGTAHAEPVKQGEPATIDPLPDPFSPHKTAVDEAEIVIVRDGEPEPPEVVIPPIEDRQGSIAGKIASVFRRKS